MRLKILGSSSRGNCYLLTNGRECLMVECGVDFKKVKRAIGFDLTSVQGVLVSHEHGDHAREITSCVEARIPVYLSEGTMLKTGVNPALATLVKSGQRFQVGAFKVMAFDTRHDAAEPLGFLISHPECGNVLFATDTYYLKYRFKGLNNILIECNYRQDILEENIALGKIPAPLRERTLKSHMSFATCLKTLKANDLSAVNNIVLIHLSDGNSNEQEFREAIAQETGKNVIVAKNNMDIEFNKTPF